MGSILEMTIGTHLACLNLFREEDGSLWITVAQANGAMAEWEKFDPATREKKPIDYIESEIMRAVDEMRERGSVVRDMRRIAP